MTGTDVTDVASYAAVEASRAADSAGVTVETVSSIDALAQLLAVLDATWSSPNDQPTVPLELLIALEHAGSYLGVAVADGRTVGAAVGFFSSPGRQMLHSHVAAVLDGLQGRGVGGALKLHQRAWCLRLGATRMEWTFDPLIARNAYFNIERLGADIGEYAPNFYGVMSDSLNANTESDRAVASWYLPDAPGRDPYRPELSGPLGAAGRVLLEVAADQAPLLHDLDVVAGSERVVVQIPRDIEALRRTRPELDHPWRIAVRRALLDLSSGGYRVSGFRRDGAYLLDRR